MTTQVVWSDPMEIPFQQTNMVLQARTSPELGAELLLQAGNPEKKHFVVGFDRALTWIERRSLARAGLRLQGAISNGVYYAFLPHADIDVHSILEGSALRTMGVLTRVGRMGSAVAIGRVPPSSIRPPQPGNGRPFIQADAVFNPVVAVSVSFHDDINLVEEARMTCSRHGGGH